MGHSLRVATFSSELQERPRRRRPLVESLCGQSKLGKTSRKRTNCAAAAAGSILRPRPVLGRTKGKSEWPLIMLLLLTPIPSGVST